MPCKHVTPFKACYLNITWQCPLGYFFPLQEVAGADKPMTNLKCNCCPVFLRHSLCFISLEQTVQRITVKFNIRSLILRNQKELKKGP